MEPPKKTIQMEAELLRAKLTKKHHQRHFEVKRLKLLTHSKLLPQKSTNVSIDIIKSGMDHFHEKTNETILS